MMMCEVGVYLAGPSRVDDEVHAYYGLSAQKKVLLL